jgi:hypothetical protein
MSPSLGLCRAVHMCLHSPVLVAHKNCLREHNLSRPQRNHYCMLVRSTFAMSSQTENSSDRVKRGLVA